MKVDNIEVSIMVKLSLWNALKLRLAGIANVMEKDRQQEAEKPRKLDNIRINKDTRKPEIRTMITWSTTKPGEIKDETWEDYEINLLAYTLGVCPLCGEIYNLIKFKQKAEEEAKKVKEENPNHVYDNRPNEGGTQDWVDERCKEAEDAGFDPALLF